MARFAICFGVTSSSATSYRDESASASLDRSLKCAFQIGVRTSYIEELKRYLQNTRRSLVLLLYWKHCLETVLGYPRGLRRVISSESPLKQFQPFAA